MSKVKSINSEAKNKITDEQLEKVVAQQNSLAKLLGDIGALEANKHSLLHRIAEVNQAVEETKKELEEQYGNVSVDLQTGEYTIIEQEEKE